MVTTLFTMSTNQDTDDTDEQLEGNFLKLNAHYVASSTVSINSTFTTVRN